VTTWTFIWLMFLLKIPIVGLFMIVRWAVKQTPDLDIASDQDGGVGPRPHPHHPHHPRARLPRRPRRGPHGEPAPASPPRTRALSSHQHLPRG